MEDNFDYNSEEKEKYNPYEVTTVRDFTAEEAKSEIRRAATKISAALLLIFVAQEVLGIILVRLLGKGVIDDYVANNINQYGFYLIAMPLIILFANYGTKHVTKTYFHKPKMTGKQWFQWACIGYMLSVVVNLIVTIVINTINRAKDAEEQLQTVNLIPDSGGGMTFLILTAIAVGVLAPIFEELLLRGACLTHLLPYGQWFAFIAIGASFGLIHGNVQQIFYAMPLGIINGIVAYKSKSIIPAIGIHAFVNIPSAIMMFCFSFISDELDAYTRILETDPDKANEMTMQMAENHTTALLTIGIIVVAMIIFFFMGVYYLQQKLKYYREDFICGNTCPVISNGKKIAAYLSSPATIVLIIIFVFMAIDSLGLLPDWYNTTGDQ